MPQPANSRARGPSSSRAAQRDAPLAVALGVDPADRARVPAAVHALQLADQLHGGGRGRAAHRGGRVQRGGERERGRVLTGAAPAAGGPCGRASRPVTRVARCCTLASRSSEGRASMSSWSQSGVSVARTSATAYWCSSTSLADASRAAPSASSSPWLRPRGVVPARTSELTSGALAPDQELGRGAGEPGTRERPAVRVALGQPGQQHPDVDVLGRVRVQVPGQHGLAEVTGLDPGHGRGHGPLPLRRGQAAVVPAHLRGRRGRGRGRLGCRSGRRSWSARTGRSCGRARRAGPRTPTRPRSGRR